MFFMQRTLWIEWFKLFLYEVMLFTRTVIFSSLIVILQLTSDIKDIYLVQIMQACAFVQIDGSFNHFLIQDFDAEQKRLKVK